MLGGQTLTTVDFVSSLGSKDATQWPCTTSTSHPTTTRRSRKSLQCSPDFIFNSTMAQGNKAYCRAKFIWTIVFTTLTRVYRGKAKFSNRFKLIHYYSGVLPSSSCQEDSKVMSSETSQETMQPRSLLDKRRTEGGEPSQGIQPGTIGLSRTTCSCCRGRTLAKETGPRLNHTKLEDTLAVVIKVANCIARLKIKDKTCVFYL